MTVEHREARARRGTGEKFLAALAQVSDVEPEAGDRLPMAASDKRYRIALRRSEVPKNIAAQGA